MVLSYFREHYIVSMFIFISLGSVHVFKSLISINNILKKDYIYPLSWEDATVDREVLEINENDTLICITTGGDNILNYLIDNPKKIITCDFNKHQNFLLEMKMSAMKNLNHDEYYEMFFNKNVNVWMNYKNDLLNELKSEECKEFWDVNGDNIFKDFIFSGSCKYIKFLLNIFPEEMRSFFRNNYDDIYDQLRDYNKIRPTVIFYSKICDFFLFQLNFIELLGVPQEQCNTNMQNKCIDFIDYICTKTLIKYNYFYKAYANSRLEKYNLPTYCKQENYYNVRDQLNKIEIYTDSLENVLKVVDNDTITKGSLLDHMDWMNDIQISNELHQLSRVVKENHKIIYRSFSNFIPKNALYKVTTWTDYVHSSTLKNVDRLGTYYTLHQLKLNKDEIYSYFDNSFANKSSFKEDMNIMKNMYLSNLKNTSRNHQDKLDFFYKNQASYYDTYRINMLHGRDILMTAIPIQNNSKWLDIGGGTGYNINLLGESIRKFEKIDIIEYSKEMYNILVKNTSHLKNVYTYCDDIHNFNKRTKYDLITFSYSLSMIPHPERALDHAIKMLKPGGIIALTDFYADQTIEGLLWKKIFQTDGVYPDNKISDWIHKYKNREILFDVKKGGFPYIPYLKCKYYIAIYKII